MNLSKWYPPLDYRMSRKNTIPSGPPVPVPCECAHHNDNLQVGRWDDRAMQIPDFLRSYATDVRA